MITSNIEEYASITLTVSCIVLMILSIVVSYYKNKDIFSPVKLYIFFNIFFYLNIYFSDYSLIILFTYFIQCLIIFLCALVEPYSINIQNEKLNIKLSQPITIIWLLSSISIINQIVVIIDMGGIFNYIGNIALRVQYFKGKGYILVLNNLISIMNITYFALLLNSKNSTKKHWLFFFIHFTIFVLMALISGSRSFLLMTILIEIAIFHYLHKRINLIKIMPFFLGIIFLIALLGGVRNSFDTSGKEIKIKGDNIELNSKHFEYGLIPLDIVYHSNDKELQYGKTYLSLITNFIPRAIYPDKLDSGGVVFTKIYTGDEWEGRSNLSTGAITEAIINFGPSLGLLIGLSNLLLFYLLGLYLYKKIINNKNKNLSYFKIIIYLYFILAFSRYSYSEFSYTFYTLILYVLIPLAIVNLYIKYTSKKNKTS